MFKASNDGRKMLVLWNQQNLVLLMRKALVEKIFVAADEEFCCIEIVRNVYGNAVFCAPIQSHGDVAVDSADEDKDEASHLSSIQSSNEE